MVLRPHDERFQTITLSRDGEAVTEVRIDAVDGRPLVLAVDAVSDRLNAQPVAQPGEIMFQFESTRSRGSVSLVLAGGREFVGPLAAVTVIEVTRGA